MIRVAEPNAFGRMYTDAYLCFTHAGPFPGMMEGPKASVRSMVSLHEYPIPGWITYDPRGGLGESRQRYEFRALVGRTYIYKRVVKLGR